MIDTVGADDVIILDKMTHENPKLIDLDEMEEIWMKPEPKPRRFTPAELWNIQRNKKPVNIYSGKIG